MANKNNHIQGLSIAVTDETIRATRQFLKDHPEEIKTNKPLRAGTGSGKDYEKSPEAFIISEFLGWSETRIFESLQRIEMEESNKLDRKMLIRNALSVNGV